MGSILGRDGNRMIIKAVARGILSDIKRQAREQGNKEIDIKKEAVIISFILDCWNNRGMADEEIWSEVKNKKEFWIN